MALLAFSGVCFSLAPAAKLMLLSTTYKSTQQRSILLRFRVWGLGCGAPEDFSVVRAIEAQTGSVKVLCSADPRFIL